MKIKKYIFAHFVVYKILKMIYNTYNNQKQI